jgi:hypothetical protein
LTVSEIPSGMQVQWQLEAATKLYKGQYFTFVIIDLVFNRHQIKDAYLAKTNHSLFRIKYN